MSGRWLHTGLRGGRSQGYAVSNSQAPCRRRCPRCPGADTSPVSSRHESPPRPGRGPLRYPSARENECTSRVPAPAPWRAPLVPAVLRTPSTCSGSCWGSTPMENRGPRLLSPTLSTNQGFSRRHLRACTGAGSPERLFRAPTRKHGPLSAGTRGLTGRFCTS